MALMEKRRRDEPMPVKYWSRAGLMLTYWCNASCASCYLSCSPTRNEWMTADEAVRLWGELVSASPHGCRVHLTGGEPFGNWELLIEVCRRAKAAGLGPLDKIETNAFWATDEKLIRDRLTELDKAGMIRLCISADPYHQQFVPISNCRMAAEVAEDVLGVNRVQVRWLDWLTSGYDTAGLDTAELAKIFARYAGSNRERLNGRAVQELTDYFQHKSHNDFADKPCREALLRSKYVHVGPGGVIMPGTCAGIMLGVADNQSVEEIWQDVAKNWPRRPVLSTLSCKGPVGLLDLAEAAGFLPDGSGYASKCHLCWDIRRHMVGADTAGDELAPEWMYR